MMKHIKRILKFLSKYGDSSDWVCYIISIYSIVSYAICYFTHIEPSRLMFANCSIAWIIIMLQTLMINELKKRIRLNNKRK